MWNVHDSEGLDEENVVKEAEKATMADLTQWVKENHKVLCF